MHEVMHTYFITSTRLLLAALFGIQERAKGRFEDLLLRRWKLLTANELVHFFEKLRVQSQGDGFIPARHICCNRHVWMIPQISGHVNTCLDTSGRAC